MEDMQWLDPDFLILDRLDSSFLQLEKKTVWKMFMIKVILLSGFYVALPSSLSSL